MTGPAVQIFVGSPSIAMSPTVTTRTAHVSDDPTVISHCPFCGSGGIVGRSDGGADCELCGRTFTVMEQPLFSNTPAAGGGASVPVTPFDPLTQETPFADGSAGAGEVPGQDQQPGQPGGADTPFGGDASGGADAGDSSGDGSGSDDSGSDDSEDKKPAFLSSLRAQNGTPLSSDDFVLHHALRVARAS